MLYFVTKMWGYARAFQHYYLYGFVHLRFTDFVLALPEFQMTGKSDSRKTLISFFRSLLQEVIQSIGLASPWFTDAVPI